MVPKLRFKEFCGELTKDKFKNLMKLQRGSSPRPINKYITTKEDGVNWIKIGDISKEDNIIKKTKEKITREGAKKSRYVQKGDLILSNSMSFGRPYLLAIDGYIHDGWFVLKEYEKNLNKNYLCQLLSSDAVKNQYKKIAAGGVVSNINSDLVNSVEVNIPSLPEQTKIANFLSTVDDKIQNQQDKITHLENIKKGFMQRIFSRKIRFKDDRGEAFPEWEENILKDYIEIITGYPFDSEKFIEENNNNPIIRIRDLQDNKISLFTTENYDLKYKVYKGDILIGMDGDFYITMWKDIEVGLNQRIMKIKPKIGLIKNNFLYYLLIPLVKHINDITPFTTVKHLSSKDILNLKVNLPCLKEQQKIEDFLSSFDEKISTEKETLEHLKQIKKGLLQQMFI